MATITEKKNTKGDKVYQVRIRRKGYPPISRYFDNLQEARTQATLLEASVLKNENTNPTEATKWTIPQVIQWYRENPDPHRKLESRKHFQRLALLEEELKDFTIATLTPKILMKWIQKRLEINSQSTVYHYYVALKNALMFHSIHHDYQQNIFTIVKCPSKPGERDRRFSIEETRTLWKSIKKTSRIKQKEMILTVLLLINLASRVGETLQLKWSEVNIEKRYVDFLAHTTKTKKFRRVPISSATAKILKWFKKHHNPNDDKELRVLSMFSTSETGYSHQFKICCDRAEIEDIRVHDLRHEGVSRLFEYVNPRTNETLSIMEIMAISGHESLVSLKRYTHLKPSTISKKFL